MKAHELRLGNYIVMKGKDYNHDNIFHDPDGDEIIKVDIHTLKGVLHGPEDYSPIHITSEILERCDFENRGIKQTSEFTKETVFVLYNIIDGTSSFVVAFIEDSYDSEIFTEWQARIDHDCIYTKELEYLHQLQNLYFALTGQELAIKDLAQ